MISMVLPEQILSALPPYRDEWDLIKENQYVPDIIKEVCEAHKLYGRYYDLFSHYFYQPTPWKIAVGLYEFCESYIRYKEEPKEDQTSALPTGIIIRGYGDCKHYSLFCAGVIGSLNRLYGCCLDANFCFVGYGQAVEPYHVFISVEDIEGPIWLDPTPGSGGTPSVCILKPV